MENCRIKPGLSKKQKGLTLVELVVVLGLFLLFIGTASAIFVSVVQQQRRVLTEQEFLNQSSYAVEYTSRALRFAVKDTTGNCLDDGTNNYPGYVYLLTKSSADEEFYDGIRFVNQDGICQRFFVDTDGNFKTQLGSGQAQNILSSQLQVNYVRFVLGGRKDLNASGAGGEDQPRVSFSLSVTIGTANPQERVLQTTVSQRKLNY